MTVIEYFRVIRSQWIVMVACLALGLMGSALFVSFAPRTYTATVTMYISAPVAGDLTSGAYEGGLLSEQRTASYSELLTSGRVLDDVINRLRLPLTVEQLRAKIKGSAPLQTVLVVASVTDGTPTGSADIANAVADSFMGLVAEIERPTDPNRPAPVVPRVIERAEPALQPTSPQPAISFALGGAVGLLLGLGLSLLRSMLDVSVRSVAQLTSATRAPVLGSIDDAPSAALSARSAMTAAVRSTSYWQLWTNLHRADLEPPARLILVTSPQHQEGKTTVVGNLAAVAAAAGFRVLVIEADLRRPRLATDLGLDGRAGLATVLTGEVELKHAIVTTGSSDGSATFDLLPCGAVPGNPSQLLSSQRMSDLLSRMRGHYDVVLVDSPSALPVADAVVLASRTDGVVVTARYGKTTLDEVGATVDAIEAVSGRVLGTVLNRAPASGRGRKAYYPVDVSPVAPLEPAASAIDIADPAIQVADPAIEVADPAIEVDGRTRTPVPVGAAVNGSAKPDKQNGQRPRPSPSPSSSPSPSPRPRSGNGAGPGGDAR